MYDDAYGHLKDPILKIKFKEEIVYDGKIDDKNRRSEFRVWIPKEFERGLMRKAEDRNWEFLWGKLDEWFKEFAKDGEIRVVKPSREYILFNFEDDRV